MDSFVVGECRKIFEKRYPFLKWIDYSHESPSKKGLFLTSVSDLKKTMKRCFLAGQEHERKRFKKQGAELI
jgi:hypothetical protein